MKRLLILVALLAALVCAVSASATTADGRVTVCGTGSGVAYPLVRIHNWHTGAYGTTTGSSTGTYVFGGLVQGWGYDVQAFSNGRASSDRGFIAPGVGINLCL